MAPAPSLVAPRSPCRASVLRDTRRLSMLQLEGGCSLELDSSNPRSNSFAGDRRKFSRLSEMNWTIFHSHKLVLYDRILNLH